MSQYEQVKQADDIEEPPVIVSMVKPMGEAQQERNSIDDWNKQEVKYAGCVGATAGCLAGGFCLSLACATGCIYCAKQEGTAGGAVARACGSYAIKAQVMAREINEQHHVVEHSKEAAKAVWNKTKDINREHQIVEKTKDCVVSAVKSGIEFTKEHNLVERTAQGVGKVISVVAKEVASTGGSASSTSSSSDDAEEDVHSEPEIIMHADGAELLTGHADEQAKETI
jgi:hypothetical protein